MTKSYETSATISLKNGVASLVVEVVMSWPDRGIVQNDNMSGDLDVCACERSALLLESNSETHAK